MKKGLTIILSIFALSGIGYYFFSPELREQRVIDRLIAKNIEARGGMAAWEKVNSLVTRGKMDVGSGVHLDYRLEQMRPGKMCISYVFKSSENYQCTDGIVGWKSLPFKGKESTEQLSSTELKEFSGTADPYGLLYNPEKRGISVRYLGEELLEGQSAHKLLLTTKLGAERTIYLDNETGLEIKMLSTRLLRGKPRMVETWYKDWQVTDGLLFARRAESQTQGDKEAHFISIDNIVINGDISAGKFTVPTGTKIASAN